MTIEKAAEFPTGRQALDGKLPRDRRQLDPRLIVISDLHRQTETELVQRVGGICRRAEAGRVVIQLRDKDASARARLKLGTKLREVCLETQQWLSVNDRADLARLLRADGLHLGEQSIDVGTARSLVGQLWISRSWHEPDAIQYLGEDALLLSPIMERRKGREPLGPDTLRRARILYHQAYETALAGKKFPLATHHAPRLYALGGITAYNAPACLDAGADGVAVIGAALDTPNPQLLLEALGILR